jgi:hypothetical protein
MTNIEIYTTKQAPSFIATLLAVSVCSMSALSLATTEAATTAGAAVVVAAAAGVGKAAAAAIAAGGATLTTVAVGVAAPLAGADTHRQF